MEQNSDRTLAILSKPQPRGLGTDYAPAKASARSERKKRILVAFAWAVAVLLFLSLPTLLIPNPIFSRAVPIRWWEYPIVAATVALTFAWFAIQAPPPEVEKNGRLIGGVTLAMFAVACPVCNHIVVIALGTAGAMSFWAPIQPYVGIFSVIAIAVALYLRIRTARKSRDRNAKS